MYRVSNELWKQGYEPISVRISNTALGYFLKYSKLEARISAIIIQLHLVEY